MLSLTGAATTPGDAVRRSRSLAASTSAPRARVPPARPRRAKSHARSKLGRARVRPAGAGPEPRVRRSRVRRGGGGAGRVLARKGRPRRGVPRASRGAGRAAGRRPGWRREPRLFVVVSRPRASFPRAAPAADALPREQRRGDVLERAGRAARFPARHRREPGHTAVRAPGADVEKIVRGQPRLLLGENASVAGAAAAAPRRAFPKVDVSAVADVEPSLLTPECDVPGRLRRLERLRSKGKLAVSRGVHRGRRGRAQRHALRQGVPRGNRAAPRRTRRGGVGVSPSERAFPIYVRRASVITMGK